MGSAGGSRMLVKEYLPLSCLASRGGLAWRHPSILLKD